ncbi:GAF domain-containing protein [Cryobacterium sp. CG_9.6]|uniref:GAF domain-containing sensor histidine kinase n=1 Tax=Cryobacterium sp. CG_9.6 TaxID=2760710 RepID=UPI0024733300|nr:GAF domain-containing protein [Cryobacterium sp. CG_9.6]MDH6237488.1 signal transduction histidine kinase [Cryobacterium sp. CG_9.6]
MKFDSRVVQLFLNQEQNTNYANSVASLEHHENLDKVLSRMVSFACRLAKAKYGALAVADSDGSLIRFISVGMDAETEEAIGVRPHGRGVIGMLVRNPQTRRINNVAASPEFEGFPPHHPPISTLMSFPVAIRDVPFGTLFVAEKLGGDDFSAEDEDLVGALARETGVSVENALLFDDAQRRTHWLRACAELARDLLEPSSSGAGGGVALQAVAERARRESGADFASIGLPTPDLSHVYFAAASGAGADTMLRQLVELHPQVLAHLRSSGEHLALPSLTDVLVPSTMVDSTQLSIFGTTLITPLGPPADARGLLILSRTAGRGAFNPTDMEMVDVFGSYVTLALELAGIHRLRQRRAVLGDRDRIAMNLHDRIMQRIFATGLSLQSLRRFTENPAALELISAITKELDATLHELRDTIYELQNLSAEQSSVHSRILAAIRKSTNAIPITSSIHLVGLTDESIDEALLDDILAVISEGVSNVARHSGATSVEASVKIERGRITVLIADNGHGITDTVRHSGLDNLRKRAQNYHGRFSVTSKPDRGTRLLWSAPITSPVTSPVSSPVSVPSPGIPDQDMPAT